MWLFFELLHHGDEAGLLSETSLNIYPWTQRHAQNNLLICTVLWISNLLLLPAVWCGYHAWALILRTARQSTYRVIRKISEPRRDGVLGHLECYKTRHFVTYKGYIFCQLSFINTIEMAEHVSPTQKFKEQCRGKWWFLWQIFVEE